MGWKSEKIMTGSAGNRIKGLPEGSAGFALYTGALGAAASILPSVAIGAGAKPFFLFLGLLAIWRYGWGLVHYTRALIYQKRVFPRLRAHYNAYKDALMPPHVYLLITSFRIDSNTSIRVFRAALDEAATCGVPATLVASVVEAADEDLVRRIFRDMAPPPSVRLITVRIPGTGKRDALAQGFRAISRDIPDPNAVVAVIDGDSILDRGLIRRTSGFFTLMPDIGALTTDEECDVRGTALMREWHDLRFAQRQMLMSSMGLSRRVLTLTGRMSMFRASIITHPDFIRQVEDDHLQHWRFGRLKFLTGDDKSSWYWLLRNKWDMLYVPDVVVRTVEHPPADGFLRASTLLMTRWFGNMLRTNARALDVAPHTTGFFTWWCLLDQRISMWTSLTGPVFVVMLCMKYSVAFLPFYLVWVGFTRWIMALMLLSARWKLSWRYPFLIYYNQVWGALVKTYMLFHLDRQRWTRQRTTLQSGASPLRQRFTALSSHALHGLAMLCFISLIGFLADIIRF